MATYHRKLAVSEPHNPASAISSSTPAAHPPGNDPAGPPGETSQLPKHQGTDAEAPAVLRVQQTAKMTELANVSITAT